jgi:glyoxylase-like metal-dependent hydrolase (beta-lactamase superfamily II)
MKKTFLLASLLLVTAVAASIVYASAQQQTQTAVRVIAGAAEALGGRERILAVKTIVLEGYGETAYMNGGGNISASPDAPQKWVSIPEYEKTIDLEHRRMRVRQRNHQNFVFASAAGFLGAANPNTVYLDGRIAYNIGQNGRAVRGTEAAARSRRLDMFNNPVVIVRIALDPSTKLSNVRTQGKLQLVDVVTATDDKLTLAIDNASHLPAWVSWMERNENLGDVTLRTAYTGYLPFKGILLPMGYNTTMDFRNVTAAKIYVDKYAVDDSIADLAAPRDLQSVPAPEPAPPPVPQVTPVARGVWLLHSSDAGGGANSILFEFSDHLTMFEAPSSQAWAKALMQRARSTVPGKPLTDVIVSHHHFDHTGGIRQAIAEGLTIIAHKGTEGLFREIAARKGTIGPDAIGANPKPLKFKAVDEHLELKDGAMEVQIYHAVSQSHMAEGVFAYVPRDKLLVQGDFFDIGWEIYFWQNTYIDNIKHWNLQVDTDVPVHGRVSPLPQVLQDIQRMTKAAQELCDRTRAAGAYMPGCPVKTPAR